MEEGGVISAFDSSQERIIERLKEQRDRDDREKTEELDCTKKELKELKERLSLMQGDLSDREVGNEEERPVCPALFFWFIISNEQQALLESRVPAQDRWYVGQLILAAVGVCLRRRPCWT